MPSSGTLPASRAAATSLVAVLRQRVERLAEQPAFTFLEDGEGDGVTWTYGDLDRRARALAAELQTAGLEGERALLLFPPGLDYVAAFWGCLYAGVVAVPAYPPGSRGRQRLQAILEDARPRLVLGDDELKTRWASRFSEELAEGPPWKSLGGVDPAAAEGWRPPGLSPESPAFLQYTSGSTALPRGVRVSHGNLLHNEALIRRAFAMDGDAVVVGWLPLYHDMGLIGNVLQTLYAGARGVLMSPLAFLERPRRWLEAIGRYGGTTSGGPNFAYDLCVDRIAPQERQGLDLSTWRVAFNGAEPVRPETLERFARAFADHGFDHRAFFPCYGLAEATLFVTGGPSRRPPVVRAVDGDALEEHRAVTVADGAPQARRLVGCGVAAEGLEVRVVDPDDGRPRCDGDVGEIWVRGESVAAGYWARTGDGTTFGARLAVDGDGGGWLRTGDLGFLLDGELFVTGRRKDLIIVRGRNLYPQDLERSAEAAHGALRPGRCAAFAEEVAGEEWAVLVAELRRTRRKEGAEAAEAVRRAVAEEHEVRLFDVVLTTPGQVPLTSSGKLRRRACREAWRAGDLRVLARSTLEGAAGGDAGAPPALPQRETLEAAGEAARGRLAAALLQRAAHLLEVEEARLDAAPSLLAAGLDSMAAAELAAEVESAYGVRLPPTELLSGVGLGGVVERILTGLETAGGAAEEVAAAPSPTPAEGVPFPLSHGQRALWFVDRLDPAAAPYNVAVAARIDGPVNAAALRRVAADVVARHPALRSVVRLHDETPVQQVRPPEEGASLQEVILDGAGWSDAELRRRLTAEALRPFDLASGPPARLVLVCDGGGPPRALLFAAHHLMVDFASLALLAEEIGDAYRALAAGSEAPAPPPAGVSYAAWVTEEARRAAGVDGETAWEHWRHRLAGAPPSLDLPTDRPRPARQRFRGAAVGRRLGRDLSQRVERLARRHDATPFMVLLAAFQALLARSADTRDVVVGAPLSVRDGVRWRRTVGYFVNPLPLRARIAPGDRFSDLLAAARRESLGALAHSDLPFPLLAERLAGRRDPGRPPLFQVLFVHHAPPRRSLASLPGFALGEDGYRLSLGALELTSLALDEQPVPYDLVLATARTTGGLALSLRYDRDLFDATSTRRMVRHLETLLAAAVEAPERRLSELPLLTAGERFQLLREWNPPPAERAHGLLHAGFEEQARRQPRRPALHYGEESWTYGALDRRSAALAARLREAGVGAEDRVGICLRRTPQMVAALLGVLRAGAAYVPLDPAYPAPRLAFMLADSGATLVLTDAASADALPADGPRRLRLDGGGNAAEDAAAVDGAGAAAPPAPLPEQLSHVIYTSGSTGRPKGVAIRHAAAAALVRWGVATYGKDELAAVLAATSICFDLSVFEIFVPLAAGGTVVLAADALELPRVDGPVTLANTVPSAMTELVRDGVVPASLRTVNLAGEALPAALVRRLHALGVERVWNLYGPSEDTTYSTGWRSDGEVPAIPPIGRPLSGSRAYVLDRDGRLLPAGVAGELHLGGPGLARGYLGRPALTAERFRPDPFGDAPGGRLYRTGDGVRWGRDGELVFLGRLDQQVKIRGFRVEPGEVETELARCAAVAECAVVARRDGDDDLRLVAYVVATDGATVDEGELRATLAASLPAHMLPARFVALDALPRTPNGKLDRRALPAPEAAPGTRRTAGEHPLRDLVAHLMAELLERPGVEPDDDFFALGGHSLLAMRLLTRLRQSYGVELEPTALFEAPTAAALARRVEAALAEGGADAAPAPRPTTGGTAPASFGQRRLWFLDRLQPGSAAYTMAAEVELAGALDVGALQRALGTVTDRHPVLHAVFEERPEGLWQVVRPAAAPTLPLTDLSALPPARRSAESGRLGRAVAARPFDLAAGPLWRAGLVRLTDGEHRLRLAFHHSVFDGWSMALFAGEVEEIYAAVAAGRRPRLAPLPLTYGDVSAWQRQRLTGDLLRRELEFWRRHLTTDATAPVPTDRPRPAVASQRGALARRRLPEATAAAVARHARDTHSTPFLVLLAATLALLGRLSGQRRPQVGAPVAGRHRGPVEGLIGFFVNTLALGADLDPRMGFSDLVDRVRRAAVAVWAHQDLPFELLVEELAPRRDLSHHPLFQVVVAEETPLPELRLPGVESSLRRLGDPAARFDLTLFFDLAGDGLTLRAEYARDLFDRTTVERLLGQYQTLLGAALEQPEEPLCRLPLMAPAQRHQILVEWGWGAPVAVGPPVHRRFAARAAATPTWPAVVAADGTTVSYGALEARANRLACELHRRGVCAGVPVAVCQPRGVALVTAVLAVLKAGGAYVALDPAHPPRRLTGMVQDSGAVLLLAPPEVADVLAAEGAGGLESLSADGAAEGDAPGPPPGDVHPEAPAYVIYTSGSTGRPKGVVVPHRSLSALVDWHQSTYRLTPQDHTTQLASPGFDAAVWELWPTLAAGATLHLPEDELLADPAGLAAWLGERGVTVCFLPTPLLEALARSGAPPAGLRALLTGGDRLHRLEAEPGAVPLFNHYGPTEATVVTTAATVRPGVPGEPPIGGPIAGRRVALLDRDGAPVALGVAGELTVAGGLAGAYLGRAAATAESFRPDPFATDGGRRYHTGDLARWRRDGELEFLGRIDHQVKVRGFRIEPGEIESVLAEHPAVTEAAVVVRGTGADRGLVAFAVAADGGLPPLEELRAHLRRRLPEYMLPQRVVALDALPLTVTGKLDRAALPGLDDDAPGAAYLAPRNAVEELLAEQWAELLGRSRVGVEDDFFALGGHSLQITRLLARVRETFGVELPVRSLFEAPTVAAQARRVTGMLVEREGSEIRRLLGERGPEAGDG